MKRNIVGTMMAVIVAGSIGCSSVAIRPLRPNWKWDGALRVMPNSIFEPVARAIEARPENSSVIVAPGPAMREELALDGTWRRRPDHDEAGEAEGWFDPGFDDADWRTMAVPNNFTIDDVSLKNFYQPVWFRRSFETPPSFSEKRLRLVFESVDYFAKVWLNGELLGEHEGYFNPFSFDVTAKLRPGKNVLVVKVTNPWDVGLAVADEHLSVAAAEKVWVKSVMTYHDSRMGGDSGNAADSQSFGTGGICRPVTIVATGEAAVDWVLISPKLYDDYRQAEVTFEAFVTNFSKQPQDGLIVIETQGENFEGYADRTASRVRLAPGPNKVKLSLKIEHPRLWWPWSHPELGSTSLYRARVLMGHYNKLTLVQNSKKNINATAQRKPIPFKVFFASECLRRWEGKPEEIEQETKIGGVLIPPKKLH